MKSKKQPITNAKRDNKTSIMVDVELNAEFRKVCDEKDLMPSKIVHKLLRLWIETERKKQPMPFVVNG